MKGNDLNLAALRRQLSNRKMVDSNIHNLAKVMFPPGTSVQVWINTRQYYGQVAEVIGLPGTTEVKVQVVGLKLPRAVRLEDVTGIVETI